MSKSFKETLIKDLLPISISKDSKIKAVADATDKQIENVNNDIEKVYIYSAIDSLGGDILDLLAWQFHLEGYELAQTDEQKRNMIKKAIELHRYKGTKWAVKELLGAVGVKAEIVEWFKENSGLNPYEFGVRCYIESPLSAKELYGPNTADDIKKLIYASKNERSWLAWLSIAISFDIELKTAIDISNLAKNKHSVNFSLYPLFDLIACDTALDLSPAGSLQSVQDKFLCQFRLGREWTLDSYTGFLLDAQIGGVEGEFREVGSFMRSLANLYTSFQLQSQTSSKGNSMWSVECSFETDIHTTTKKNMGAVWEQGQTGLDCLPAFDQLALDFAPLDYFMEV